MPKNENHIRDALKWAKTHHSELLIRYPDEWVAVYENQVVAHGPNGERVEQEAKQKLGDKNTPIYFVDSASSL